MFSHDKYMRGLEQQLAFDQLARYFRDTVESQFSSAAGAGLYGFLLAVLDKFRLNEDMTIEKFMARATEVYRENFPQVPGEQQEAA